MECRLPKYTLPEESVATRGGSPMEVPLAAAGVGGAAPPATVEIRYCWPHAAAAQNTHKDTRAQIIFSLACNFPYLYHAALRPCPTAGVSGLSRGSRGR